MDKNIPPTKKGCKKTMSNIKPKHQLHRVCTPLRSYRHFDQNQTKTYKNNSNTLLLLIKQHYHVYYSILTIKNMLTSLRRFIIHLFINIYNLLYIYLLLFIILVVYIVYDLFLFLEEKNKKLIPQKSEGCFILPSFSLRIIKMEGLC